jgi:hypothetical protein
LLIASVSGTVSNALLRKMSSMVVVLFDAAYPVSDE